MSRSKHQFRPGVPEVFETRIVPTVTPIGGTPFVPPGQVATNNPPLDLKPPDFSCSGNTVIATAHNSTDHSLFVTFAIYTAPGGGYNNTPSVDDPLKPGSENLASQKLVYQVTVTIAAGDSYTFHKDVSELKLTGQEKLQCDAFVADNSDGYAPVKIDDANLNGHLFGGHLYQYDDTTPSNGKKK